MPRKDIILQTFLKHPLIASKYEISDLPDNIKDALVSKTPIVRAIALIIENLEIQNPVTDASLKALINQYLNQAAI